MGGYGMPMGGSGGREVLDVPQNCVGAIIGKGGHKIKEIREGSGANVKVDQDHGDGRPRQVVVSGRPDQIAMAKQVGV